jgi:surface antigen
MVKRTFLAFVCASLLIVGSAPVRPVLASPDSVDKIDQQLSAQKAELDELNARVEHANGELDRLDEQLARDELRLGQLRHQASQLARFEYERRDLTLVERAASASSLGEFLTELNESRLLAARERGLVDEARTVRRQDEAARAQQAAKVAELQADRDRAAQAVQHSELLRAQAEDAARRDRAEALVAQARATQSAVQPPPASSARLSSRPNTAGAPPAATSRAAPAPAPAAPPSGTVVEPPGGNHFAFGYCTWYVATRRNIPWFGNAIEWWPNARSYGYAEGQAPVVGAVMVTRESSVGHVAYVESVGSDGSWTVSEMNYVAWNVTSRRTLRPGQASVVGFIYGRA